MRVRKITILQSWLFLLLAFAPIAMNASVLNNLFVDDNFTQQPVSVASCPGGTAQFTVVYNNGNIQSYQWQKDGEVLTDGNGISGAATATLTISPVSENDYAAYQCVVTYQDGTATSEAAYLSGTTVSAGTISENQSVCRGATATISITEYTGSSVQWQQSANGVDGWEDVIDGNGGTTATYTTGTVTGIIYYRAVVTEAACGRDYSDVVSVTPIETIVWTGASGSDWADANNWSCGNVPVLTNDVVIPGQIVNQPVISAWIANANSIVVESGASLTVAGGGTLNLINTLFVDEQGSLVVENNGALVQQNSVFNNGIITVEKNSNPLYRLDYTMWSSPVAGQKLRTFSMGTSNNRFYEYKYGYSENRGDYFQGYWNVDPNTTSFEAAKGYLIRMPNSDNTPGYNDGNTPLVHTGIFTGVPYNGNVQVNASTNADRYTGVGNPYASPISVYEFFTQNAGVVEAGSAIYLWRKRNNRIISSYATVTLAAFVANDGTNTVTGEEDEDYASGGQDQAGYFTGESTDWTLAPGQGFIVKADANITSGTIKFTNSMRRAVPLTGGQGFFRQAPQQAVSRLYLNLTNREDGFSQAAIAYMNEATNGIDAGYDGKKIADGETIEIYTLAANNELVIQARPAFNNNDVVPAGYKATTAGTYTISLDRAEGIFTAGQQIYLNDKLNGIVHNLSNNAYTFPTEAGTFNDRFEIIYSTSALGTDQVAEPLNVVVYKQGGAINIASGMAEMTGVSVYDIGGRQLYNVSDINTNETVINNISAAQQVLIVEVNTVKGKVSKKIIF